MIKFLASIIFIFLSCLCNAQTVFQKVFSSPDTNLVWSGSNILFLQDSSFLMLCNNKNPYSADTSKMFIIKVSHEGTIIWQKVLSTDSTLFGGYINFADNGFIITASSFSKPYIDNGSSVVVIKMDFSGNILWHKSYLQAGHVNYIQQAFNGDFVIIGTGSPTTPDGQKHYIMRINSIGDVIFYNKYIGITVGTLLSGFCTLDGGYLLYSNPMLAKMDSIGNVEWLTDYYAPIPTVDAIETSDSSYIVLGNANNTIVLIKFNNQGDTTWMKGIGGSFDQLHASSIIQLQNGDLIISGRSRTNLSNSVFRTFLLKTDPSGNVLWSRNYDFPPNLHNWGLNVSSILDNQFLVQSALWDSIPNTREILLTITDSTGNLGTCIVNNANLYNVSIPSFTSYTINLTKLPLNITSNNISLYNNNGFVNDSYTCYNNIVSFNEIVINEIGVSINPNPASNVIIISTSQDDWLQIEIYDVTGRRVKEQNFQYQYSMTINDIPKGIYIYKVKDKQRIIKKGKFIKN